MCTHSARTLGLPTLLSPPSLFPQAYEYRPLLTTLFSRYVDPCLEYCRRNFKTVVPLPAVNQVGRREYAWAIAPAKPPIARARPRLL